jgi:tetratricopeptide (TPR) repeat protein
VKQETLRRRLARMLLALGIRVAPRHAEQWGQAMLAELGEVKGEWAALMWAAGGASVMAKHALVAMVLPGRNAPAFLPGGGLFEKEGPMRKASLSIVGACVLAALLFLLAPTFRQGLRVAMVQWRAMSDWRNWSPSLGQLPKALAEQAEQKHDAEAIAFLAVRSVDPAESTRLADEAVRMDPKLTWIYSMAGTEPGKSEAWIQKLEAWDPQNALPYLMEAENIDLAQEGSRKIPQSVDEQSAAWKAALAAVYRSSKLDVYQDRLGELTRKVVTRYGLRDPYQIFDLDCFPCLPSYAGGDARDFAKWQLKNGDMLEARGDYKGALEKYGSVIRFSEEARSLRLLFTHRELKKAYQKAGEIFQKQGDKAQAELYADLAQDATRAQDEQIATFRQNVAGNAIARWNANVMKVGGLLLPIFASLLLIWALTIVMKNRPLRLGSLRAGPGTVALGMGSAIGLLLSSALLYVGYWPYAEIFQEFVNSGNGSRMQDLDNFLGYAEAPLGTTDFMNQADFVVYFWLTVIALCGITLIMIAARHMHIRRRIRVTS